MAYGGFSKISSVKLASVRICDLQAVSDDDVKHDFILLHRALARICDPYPSAGVCPPVGIVASAVGLPVLVPSPEQAVNINKNTRQHSVFIYFLFGEIAGKLENYIDRFDLDFDPHSK